MTQPDFHKTWKKQLIIVWIAQFIAANGFSFGLPFAPFFLQKELGVPFEKLPFYISLFGASAPLMMMVFSPVWGSLADRFGRRKMLLRSYIGGAVVFALMGVAVNPAMLIILRLLQGMFCGTISAAQTLVATQTPDEHSGVALGSLHSAMFSGHMTGSFLGGIFAEYFGYRNAFFVTAILMSLSFFLVWQGVVEYFVPDKTKKGRLFANLIPGRKIIKPALALLLLMGFISFCRQLDIAFVPLMIQNILGTISGASGWTGALSAVCGLAGVISGFTLGVLSDRFPPGRIAVCSALCTASALMAIAHSTTLTGVFVFRFIAIFVGSGIDLALQIWLSRRTAHKDQGVVFGCAASLRSGGMFLAPLAAGAIVSAWDIKALYIADSFFFIAAVFLILKVDRKTEVNNTTL